MDLGLNTLTDDQLVELARAIATELVSRNPAVADAAQNAIRDEIARVRDSQDTKWTRKKWLALMAREHVGSGCEISVWRARDAALTRVYLDIHGPDRRGRDHIKWCLHVTGDSKNPPGSLTCDEGSRAKSSADAQIVRLICQHALAAFAEVRIDCDQAVQTDYDVPSMPADVVARAAEIEAAAAAEAARNAYRASQRTKAFAEHDAAAAAALAEHGKKHDWELPRDVQSALDDLRTEALARLNSAMDAYDAERGN